MLCRILTWAWILHTESTPDLYNDLKSVYIRFSPVNIYIPWSNKYLIYLSVVLSVHMFCASALRSSPPPVKLYKHRVDGTDGSGASYGDLRSDIAMSYKPIAPAPSGSNHTPPGSSVPSPSLPSSSNFRPAFSDFGPPSMGFVQPVKVSQGSTYSELLSVIEEMSREIRPTYAGSKSAMERLKRGIIHARALVRECLAETERSART